MEKEQKNETYNDVPVILEIGHQAVKSAEQLLAEYDGNDEQYIAYLKGEYPDPRD